MNYFRIYFKQLFLELSILATLGVTSIHAQSSSLIQSLAGQWLLTASNNGKEIAPGLYAAGKDTINVIATIADDGQSLNCYADCLYKSATGKTYPADWKIIVEENSQGQYRLGWVLTDQQPAFITEFQEGKESYLEKGFWYWGTDETDTHRYIYLLAENEDASAHVATTFWSEWGNKDRHTYSLTSTEYNSQKLYAIVATSIPYANSVGYVEIWASPKLRQISSTGIDGITNTEDSPSSSSLFDISGRRLRFQPQRGLYIKNRKTYYQR